MTFALRMIIVTMLFLVYPANFVKGDTVSYAGPDDLKAIQASEAAMGRLDEDKGAVPVEFRSVEVHAVSVGIIGLATAISGQSVGVEETLRDLHAKRVGTEIQISLAGDVLFDFDKWNIKSEAETTLAKIAGVVIRLKRKHVLIEGHTDSRGSDSYNQHLSRKRADSVKNWFLKKGGLDQVTFTTKGYGEAKPVTPNTHADGSDNPEGRARNRRVEIRIQ